jgi:hypothetical protein
MVRYELLACRRRRWEVDRLLEDKQSAVEEARTLVERDPLVSAVRVIRIESRKNGIAERQVCTVAAPSFRVTSVNRSAGPDARHTTRRSFRPSSGRKVLLAVGAIFAAIVMLGYGVMLPKQPWVFDLPAAQMPHMIRDTFTGAYSQAQQ